MTAASFEVLLRMQMARIRTSWRPYLIVSSVMPLGIAVLLRAVMSPAQIARHGEQIVAGSAVLAISMTAVVMLAQRVATLKENGAFDYFSTLPVSRSAVAAAILISFSVFALPGMIIVVGLGSVMFSLAPAALWSVVPVWLLCSLALAGIGVALGLSAPDEQLAGMFSNLVMMAVLFLGILPPEQIPGWLDPLRLVLPSTYAIDALRPGLEGAGTSDLALDLAVLAGFAAVSFAAISGPLWPHRD